MNIREEIEKRESEVLNEYASKSVDSLGRKKKEQEDDTRTCYMRDRDRILHSKSFRRLKNKTQVFLRPEDDHFRTRLTHTLEVSQISRTISKALNLNEDLTEAIALGHDLGHTPYGHSGEYVLNQIMEAEGGHFKHNEQSYRIVDVLEKNNQGLNLTYEVLDGILNHGMDTDPKTMEGKVVRLSDKIAYLHHDMDDAIRAGVLAEQDIPKKITDILGDSVRKRLNTLVEDIVLNSHTRNDIIQTPEIGEAMLALRRFMFERVYTSKEVKKEEKKAQAMIESLYWYYCKHTGEIPESYRAALETGETVRVVVCDYIAGMTDQYAVQTYTDLVIPSGWKKEHF